MIVSKCLGFSSFTFVNHAFEPVDTESQQALEVDGAGGVCRTRSSKPVERKAKVLQFVGRGQRTAG